jgi:thiazole synthase ThiGH ThiG subunit
MMLDIYGKRFTSRLLLERRNISPTALKNAVEASSAEIVTVSLAAKCARAARAGQGFGS